MENNEYKNDSSRIMNESWSDMNYSRTNLLNISKHKKKLSSQMRTQALKVLNHNRMEYNEELLNDDWIWFDDWNER